MDLYDVYNVWNYASIQYQLLQWTMDLYDVYNVWNYASIISTATVDYGLVRCIQCMELCKYTISTATVDYDEYGDE